jgi:signal transduction protein with GAF and PtsI domain
MVQTGYHKKRLGEIAPEVIEMDPLFSRYYEERFLNAFLKTCTLALDADSGSVMTVDKDTNLLRIKVASKIDEDIIYNTKMRVGSGIAGVAAANAEPILLPKDKRRTGLSKKMKRKYIKSSMIVPFNKANEDNVYGVVNLNILRKKRDFSEKDIAFVRELTNLASIALVPVK